MRSLLLFEMLSALLVIGLFKLLKNNLLASFIKDRTNEKALDVSQLLDQGQRTRSVAHIIRSFLHIFEIVRVNICDDM